MATTSFVMEMSDDADDAQRNSKLFFFSPLIFLSLSLFYVNLYMNIYVEWMYIYKRSNT